MSDGIPGDGYSDVTPWEIKRRVCEIMGWEADYDYMANACRSGTVRIEMIERWKAAEEQARKL